jgi:hypothetical protein
MAGSDHVWSIAGNLHRIEVYGFFDGGLHPADARAWQAGRTCPERATWPIGELKVAERGGFSKRLVNFFKNNEIQKPLHGKCLS